MTRPWQAVADGLVIAVRLTPRGGADRIDGCETGADGSTYLKARVRAVAEDGKANAALIGLLAGTLGLRKSAISLASGATSRQKRLKVEGDYKMLAARLETLLTDGVS